MDVFKIHLNPSRESSLLRRHPWIFSGAIERVEGNPQSGDTVEILSAKKQWLGRGAFSPQSQIRVRVWTFDEQEKIDAAFFQKKLNRALLLRNAILPGASSYRLVYGESDGFPGLIVDRYHDFLVAQFLAAGVEKWKQEIVAALNEVIPNKGIYERSDASVREKEGLPLQKGLLTGAEPPELIEIEEGDYKFLVDVRNGHKTGFYLDQRENRMLVAKNAKGADILNCFAYTGAFAVAALKGGAKHVTNIDSSADSLKLADQNTTLNKLDLSKTENVVGDVFSVLRKYRSEQRRFDIILLDPPKLAESKQHLEKAARAYKDANLVAFQLLNPGGMIFTFSCSGLLEDMLFQKIVADAALDAQREVSILHRMFQSPDHPVALNFPEAGYLKGLVCRAV